MFQKRNTTVNPWKSVKDQKKNNLTVQEELNNDRTVMTTITIIVILF